jgi:hypothetical protein
MLPFRLLSTPSAARTFAPESSELIARNSELSANRQRTHIDAALCQLAQQRVESVAAAATLNGVAPDQHAVDAPQVGGHLVGEVVVIDGGLSATPAARSPG